MRSLVVRWKALDVPGKCYLTAKVLLSLGIVAILFFPPEQPTTFLLFSWPILMLFLAGFLAWAVPQVMRRELPRVGTWALIGLQAILVPLCIAQARHLVSDALGLPPQFFDLTVALLAVLLLPFAWAILLVLVSIAAMVVCGVIWLVVEVLIRPVLRFFFGLGGRPPQSAAQTEKLNRWGDHGLGFVVVLCLVLSALVSYETTLNSPELIRLAAYFLDFSEVTAYPDVLPGRPMRLLDNGNVAYADRTGWDIQIRVACLKPCQP